MCVCLVCVCLQGGVDPEDIAAQLELLSQDEPDCVDTRKLPDSPDPLPYNTLKLHSPPRYDFGWAMPPLEL